MDGTVLDTNQIKRDAFFSSASQAVPALNQSNDHLYSVLSYHHRDRLFEEYVRGVLRRVPTHQELQLFMSEYKRRITEGHRGLHAMPGFKQFAERVKGRYRLFVASTAPQDEVDMLLDSAGVSDYFERTFGFPTSKVKAIQCIVESDRLAPQTLLYVGDHMDDQVVAETAGTHYCRLAAGSDADADVSKSTIAKTFDEMIQVLFDLELLNGGASA
jgi:phosphoglycolate phosphatase-like HAD superfamily hydrolase